MKESKLHLIGYASGIAGADDHVSEGPVVIKKSQYLANLLKQGAPILWDTTITLPFNHKDFAAEEMIGNITLQLAKRVSQLIQENKSFCVLGGDHTSAIGTWSGAFDALHQKGDLGLIWVDAHMDSHTPETTESGHIHGMPLACLLGFGYPNLINILHSKPKFKPQHVFLIGVRNFEKGEALLLKRLGVRIYYMDEIKRRGFNVILREVRDKLKEHTIGYGLSFDIDGIDPKDAPGVDVPEPDGIPFAAVSEGLKEIMSDPKLIGTEIIEFDPSRDKNHMTEKIVILLLEMIAERNPSIS